VGNWGIAAFDSRNAIPVARAIRANIGVFTAVVDVFLGMVNWLRVSPRPMKVKESLVVEKTAAEADRETISRHGDRRHRDLRGSAVRRNRIAGR